MCRRDDLSTPPLPGKPERECELDLRGELKDALVQPGVTNNLPANTGAQNGFEHVLLEPSNDGVTLQHVQDRGMTLQDVRTTILVVIEEFRHVAFTISHMRKPFRAVGDGVSLRFGSQSRGLLFE